MGKTHVNGGFLVGEEEIYHISNKDGGNWMDLKSKKGVCSETNASDPIIGYPRAPHLTTNPNNEPCPIYQFCDLERIKKNILVPYSKKTGLVMPYHWMTTVCGILCTEGKKTDRLKRNPQQDIQFQGKSSVLQVDNPTCARTW